MLRVMQVASSVTDPTAGTDYAINSLCGALAARGHAVQLHTLQPLPSTVPAEFTLRGYRRWSVPAKLGVSPNMRAALLASAADVDVVHGHGLWMMPNLYAAMVARRKAKPYIFSVHGMMASAAMKRSRVKKLLFTRAGQSKALRAVDCFHATSQDEYLDIRRLGYRSPVCIVPFGIDIPVLHSRPNTTRRTLLFLGRIHPIKRIDILLMAWRGVQDAFLDWDLVICGPDNDGYLPELHRLASELSVTRVTFAGPKHDAEKTRLFEDADLFVLPSDTENFGFVVAEALAHSVPAIVNKGAPWSGLAEQQCGWWIDSGRESLEKCLREALALDASTVKGMGVRGRDWMSREFSWARTAEMMEETYQWLLGQSERPDWIHVD